MVITGEFKESFTFVICQRRRVRGTIFLANSRTNSGKPRSLQKCPEAITPAMNVEIIFIE
jgi:hypothetical protein